MEQTFDVMEQTLDVDDFLSGNPAFFIPSRLVWSDFVDFFDDDTKGDLNESQC